MYARTPCRPHSPRRLGRCGAVVTASALLLWSSFTPAQEAAPVDFYHDFRGRPLPPELPLFQVEDNTFVRSDPAGLRITLPRTYRHPPNGVGCRASFTIRGDVDVTATVELLDVEAPPKGVGAGVGLSVETASAGVQLRRQVGMKGKHALLANRYQPVPDNRNLDWKQRSTPCPDSLVRLRLKRTGTTAYYLWAPGAAGDAFKELHQFELGNDDIEHVRLFAFNNQHPCAVDVRLIDLRIRSGNPSVGAAALTPPGAASRLWLAVVVGIALAVGLGLAVWHGSRSRTRHRATPAPAAVDALAAAVALMFACPECGTSLKARPELAGKRIKCRQCGKAIRVPQAAPGDSGGTPL
jgi:predicted RNA-binding Zn-ribbon protein involved in translation (DUF1610 family)